MDLEDLISGRRHGKLGYPQDHHTHEDHGKSPIEGEHEAFKGHREHRLDLSGILAMVGSLPHIKLILAVIAVGALLVLVLGIILLVTLLPLLGSAVSYVSQNGLQGVVEYFLPRDGLQGVVNQVNVFLERLWKGSG